MRTLAIDPGPTESGWVVYEAGKVLSSGISATNALTPDCGRCLLDPKHVVFEMVACYGMPVGESVFETVFNIGRLWEAWDGWGVQLAKVYRRDVKLHLCNSARAKDANIRQAIIDRYPATGGGKVPQIGTKKKPGPLYGVKSHAWAALAVAITYSETEDAGQ